MRKKINFFIVLLMISISTISSANDKVFPKNNIGLSFSDVLIEQDGSTYNNHLYSLKMEYGRALNSIVSAGVYTGYGVYREYIYQVEGNSRRFTYDQTHGRSVFYGLSGRIDLLPILFERVPSFITLYIKYEAGVVSMYSSADKLIIPIPGHFFDFSNVGGCAVNFSRSFGLFAEYGYRRFQYANSFHGRYGLVVRF